MIFVSHAQNFEDVILFRALRDVQDGFYIDVGANDPEGLSVTKAFYERGWHGINIEPVMLWWEKLRKARPADINLNVAAGSTEGKLRFFDVVGTGLSTSNEETARRHARELGFVVQESRVPVTTLTKLCAEHDVGEVHFLKVDVEGAEREVLAGLDLSKTRPWIVMVEATLPTTQQVNYEEWEPLLTEHDYRFVYFDGLNRFYVADEHSELRAAFAAPPNVFDQFQTQKEAAAILDIEQLETTLQNKEAERARVAANLQVKEVERNHLQAERDHLQAERDHLQAVLHAITHSVSWRLTEPLRIIRRAVVQSVRGLSVALENVHQALKDVTKPPLLWAMERVAAHPRLKSWSLRQLDRFPLVEQPLRRLWSGPGKAEARQFPEHTSQSGPDAAGASTSWAYSPDHPSIFFHPQAKIYRDLAAAIEKASRSGTAEI